MSSSTRTSLLNYLRSIQATPAAKYETSNHFPLCWAIDQLVPTLDQIAENAAGEDNPQLWEDIYKEPDASGGPFLSGWILKFFPYPGNESTTRNPLFLDADKHRKLTVDYHITTESLPSSLSKVPFVWKYFSQTYSMELLAGFTGFTQDSESFLVRPKIGWAV